MMRHKARQGRRERGENPPKQGGAPGVSIVQPLSRRTIRVIIADRHEVIRVGVRVVLEEEIGLKIVGEVEDIDGLLAEVRQAKPDVILLESWLAASLESAGYRKLLRTLPSVRIIALLGDNDAGIVTPAIEWGIRGYLSTRTCHRELGQAIRIVSTGGSYVGSKGSDRTPRFSIQRHDAPYIRSGLDRLSPQERRVIALIAEGNTNKEIATTMVLSEKTVKNYIVNVFAKLDIERRTQAVALYFRARQGFMAFGNGVSAQG